MTDPQKQALPQGVDAAGDLELSPYSKDYWDNVFEQIGRRPFVKAALAVLALLYASAIYAPLLANDRPFHLRAVDYRSYGRDLKTIYASSISMRALAQKDRESYLADLERSTEFRRYESAVREESQGLAEDCLELQALLAARLESNLERGVRLAEVGAASDAALAAQTTELREWLTGIALAALREVNALTESGVDLLATEQGREALADLRQAMERERARLAERAQILSQLTPPDRELAAELGVEVGSSLLEGLSAKALEAGNVILESQGRLRGAPAAALLVMVEDVRERVGDALVVGKLPESGRTLVREFVGRARELDHLGSIDEAAYLDEQQALELYRPFEDAVREERSALAGFALTVRTYLPADPPEYLERVDALEARADSVVAAILEGRSAEAETLADQLKDEAKALRSELAARDPQAEVAAGEEPEGVPLVPASSLPLWESVSAAEIFFMVLWALVLTWPVWNAAVNKLLLGRDRDRIRTWRKRKLWSVLGASLVIAVVWKFAVGGETAFDSASYKEGISSGDIVLEDPERDVSFPLLAMGYAENHTDERFRPPTWHATSEISEQGYYVTGPRKPEPDPLSGEMQPPNPVDVRFAEPERNAPLRHALGTDSVGRDILTRLLYGGRISLSVGILSTVLLVFIGVVMGALAGYFGGRIDMTISRVIEIVQAFPAFFLILTAVALIPEDKVHPIFAIVFFIAIVRWTGVARLVRGEFLRLRDADFAMAARALGFSPGRVIFRHVLPNAMGPVLVAAAFSVAAGILTESGISFLGLGIKQPIPSWGQILNESRDSEQWWIQVFPGLLIFVTVFCYNVVGEGFRDALDPRRKV